MSRCEAAVRIMQSGMGQQHASDKERKERLSNTVYSVKREA